MANRDGVPRNFKVMEFMDIQELKPKQIELLKSFVSSRDTFILPTGYGKSIILVEVVPVVSWQRPHA